MYRRLILPAALLAVFALASTQTSAEGELIDPEAQAARVAAAQAVLSAPAATAGRGANAQGLACEGVDAGLWPAKFTATRCTAERVTITFDGPAPTLIEALAAWARLQAQAVAQ